MRAAPPVQATSQAAGLWRFSQLALGALAAASLVHWVAGWLEAPESWDLMACGVAALLAWLVAARCALPTTHGLRWNGSVWSIRSQGTGEAEGAAGLMIDLGSWLLVRFERLDALPDRHPHARLSLRQRVQWLSLSRHDNPASWHGLRVALHSSASPPGTPAAADPAG
jgi:hypothetical protein